MPRRNHRHREVYEPLDLTPAEVMSPKNEPLKGYRPAHVIRSERAERERQAIERQRNARVNKGIDWGVCLVPGCGDELIIYNRAIHSDPEWRDHTVRLPLCGKHLSVAHAQANTNANNALMVKATTQLLERRQEKNAQVKADNQTAWLKRTAGHIYFVRLNGLIKVGWSRDVDARLRAYGPDVEVLAIYEGTRTDETNLHRQLRPALAAGREWYEDGKILADFVAAAVAEHGPPEVFTEWTRPKQIIRTRKRSA